MNLKVLHLPSTFLPDYTGGKEVYTLRFVQALEKQGCDNIVVIHGKEANEYTYEGVKVVVLPPYSQEEAYIQRYTRTVGGLISFIELLQKFKPDIVHFHDQHGGASLSHLEAVKEFGSKAVVTFHTPGQICPQWSLLYANKEMCDGYLEESRCNSCQLQSFFNAPKLIADAITALSKVVSPYPNHKLSKLFAQRRMTRHFIDSYRQFCNKLDALVVFSPWAEKIFQINGFDQKKIWKIDTAGNPSLPIDMLHKHKGSGLEICFIGRCEEIKGIHILIEAVKQLPKEYDIRVYFYSGGWNNTDYGRFLLGKIQNDTRFQKPLKVSNTLLAETISKHDLCVIPSLWPETGPLTLFDAFGSGLPVIGSDRGGIGDRVDHLQNGLLFEPNNVDQLKNRIEMVYNDRDLLENMRIQIQKNRTMARVAEETKIMYNQLLSHS